MCRNYTKENNELKINTSHLYGKSGGSHGPHESVHNHVHKHDCDCNHHEHENHSICSCVAEDHMHEHNHEHDCDCVSDDHGHTHKHQSMDHCCSACAQRSEIKISSVKGCLFDIDRKIDLSRIIISGILLLSGGYFAITPLIFAAYIMAGYEVIWAALKSIFNGKALDENFLMLVSTIGAIYVGQYPEAAGVMLFFSIGEFFEDLAVDKSRRSISQAMDIKSDSATKKIDNSLITVAPEELQIGDTIIVKPGEKIPVDGTIISGNSTIDTSAITGESIPRSVSVGDEITSGFVNGNATLEIKATATFHDSAVGKILELVENSATRKTHMERFITKFAKFYTPTVVFLAVVLTILPPLLLNGEFKLWLYRAMTFLVISCPCALVISVPMTLFAGIGAASSKGIVIKGSNYLEAFARLKTIAFDKTGTLTHGIFQVEKFTPVEGVSKKDMALAAYHCEHLSNHPIAEAITKYCAQIINSKDYSHTLEESPVSIISSHPTESHEELPGLGVMVHCLDSSKEHPHKQLYAAGNSKMMNKLGITVNSDEKNILSSHSASVVYIATYDQVTDSHKLLGTITISDKIREESKATIDKLRSLGIKNLVMLTGDRNSVAKEVSNNLGMTEFHGELLPHDKVGYISKLIEARKNNRSSDTIAFIGDGINDAPVLAISDIGVAMGALGSDAAIEAADIVMMTDSIKQLPLLVSIAQKTVSICKQNIIFAIGIKVLFLALGALGLANLWMAVFADVGVTCLAILNALRALKTKQ
ncbi:heavy metal translocating P-type ATPase [Eubacteriales bacterium KG127]